MFRFAKWTGERYGSPFRTAFALASRGLRLRRDDRGNILVIFGVALPLLVGALGLGVDGASWYQAKRSLQNAADEAVIAAATNASSNYATEAKAITSRYGFTHGAANVTVTASNAATCPGGATNCYSVTVTKKLPLIFMQVVGFAGNTTVGGRSGMTISSTAVATRETAPREYCILALATSGTGVAFLTNGAPKADLSGCNIMSNTSMTCNGHNLGADYGDAHGTNNGCGLNQTSSLPQVSDPYSSKASNIPSNTCSTYPQKPSKNKDPELPASNKVTGSQTYTTKTFCGDVQLTGDVTLNGTQNVIVIRNGQLDTNGYTIRTASGAAATIIFSGDNTAGYNHTPTGGGKIDIAAPTSGTWSGVAMYADPAITTGTEINDAGNSPSWNVTGLAYFPRSSVTFSGAVGKATNGKACFIMVVDNIRINGTGSILNRGQCSEAGLTPPASQLPIRGKLVA